MRYMYTTTPDEHCHEVKPGVYGRPVHTYQEAKLRKLGWAYNHDGLQQKQEQQEEAQDQEVSAREELEALYKEHFGKKPHHKMKDETILEKLKEAAGDDQG